MWNVNAHHVIVVIDAAAFNFIRFAASFACLTEPV